MAPCVMDFELELTQIHNWLDVFVTFRPLLEHVYSKASQQTKNIYWSMVICNNFVQVSKILCNKDGQTKWLLRPSRTTILDNISHLKSSRIASLCPPLLKIRFQLVSHSSWVMWDCRALWWVRRHKGELPPNWLLDSSKFTSSVGVKSYIGRSMSAWGWSPPPGWEKTAAGKDVKKK